MRCFQQEDAMSKENLKRTVRMAAYALVLTLTMSGLALAQDDDDYYYRRGNPDQARQYGYQSGYRDGVAQGRHEGQENDPYDFHTPDWRQATRGYQNWMGPVNWYQRGYQDGYGNGFQSGFQSVSNRWRDSDGDRDDGYREWWRDRDGDRYGSPAYQIGYQDGSGVARRDIERHNSYNPNPRGRFDDEDHGYRRDYGSKDQYKAEYANGYRAGYAATMGNRY
jgi:hypothetical protein